MLSEIVRSEHGVWVVLKMFYTTVYYAVFNAYELSIFACKDEKQRRKRWLWRWTMRVGRVDDRSCSGRRFSDTLLIRKSNHKAKLVTIALFYCCHNATQCLPQQHARLPVLSTAETGRWAMPIGREWHRWDYSVSKHREPLLQPTENGIIVG